MNKQEIFNINGMMRDLGNSKSSPKYAYDIMNMRLFNFEENTAGNLCNDYGNHLLRVVDSRGRRDYNVLGHTVGICKINSNTIIIFTAGESTSYIYKGILRADNSALQCSLLYEGNLKFDTNHPIESLYNYENEKSQKIYWTDGKNPLRQINLAADRETMSSWTDSSFLFNPYLQLNEEITVNRIAGGGQFHAGTVQYAFTYYNLYGPESAVFYNTPLYYAAPEDRGGAADEIINCSFNINIKRFDKNFDFLRVYAIQRTSINGTPVARKVSDIVIPKSDYLQPEYTLSQAKVYNNYSSFFSSTIKLFNLNGDVILNGRQHLLDNATEVGTFPDVLYQTKIPGHTFSKIQIGDTLYSVPELNGFLSFSWDKIGPRTVTVSSSQYPIKYTLISDEESLNIVDDGIVGESVDYTSLLYKGGEEITAQTLDSKDNTLFLGNISLKKPSLLNLNVGGIPLTDYVKTLSVEFNYNGNKTLPSPTKNSFYPYINQLRYNSEQIKHFKQGSVYRLGFQAQYQDGTWSTVIYIKDVKNDKPIKTTFYEDGEFQFPTPEVILTQPLIETLLNAGYKRVRPVVAFSTLPQWSFQGIVNPTMYKIDSRARGTLFSQASWFYRPSSPYDYSRTKDVRQTGEASKIVDVFDVDTSYYYAANVDGKRGIQEKWDRLNNQELDTDVDYKASRFFTLTGQHHSIYNDVLNKSLKLVNKQWAEYGADIEFRHGQALNGNLLKKSEIQCLSNIDKYKLSDTGIPSYIRPFKNAQHTDQVPLDSYLDNYDQTYIIDQSIFNIDSPDLNFDSLLNRSLDNSKFRIVGAIPMTTNYSAYDIMIDGTTTPYTWNSLDGGMADKNVWAPPYALNEWMLRNAGGGGPDKDEYPQIEKEVAIRYPDGQVDLKLGTNLFSPQAWRTNSAVPIWQDNMVTASLFRIDIGSDVVWAASTATAALFINKYRRLLSDNFDAYFTVYPWHSRFLNNYTTKLKTKVLSNIKVSFKSIYLTTLYTDMQIQNPSLFTSDLDIIKIQDYFGNTILYGGNVDQICTAKIDNDRQGYDITLLKGTNTTEIKTYYGWSTMPNHVSWTRGKMLKKDFFSQYSAKPLTTVESELRIDQFANVNEHSNIDNNYRDGSGIDSYEREFMRQITSKDPVSIKYKTTKHLVITSKAYLDTTNNIDEVEILPTIIDSRVDSFYNFRPDPIEIPPEDWVYRNWAVNQLTTDFYKRTQSSSVYYPFWSDSALKFTQKAIDSSDLHGPAVTSKSIQFGWLWLGELYNDIEAFPGSSEENLEQYIWHPCASPIKLVLNNTILNNEISMYYYEGDTYYQRYDSLKTYPYTNEDPNQVIDLVSFMCETTKNIDGRYDKNRNTTFTSTISPTNFNLINEAYSQPNNFFQQRYISQVQSAVDKFENAITWSLTKTNGEEIDSWTKLNLASILDLDGDRGPVNKIKKFNNDLIAFQDSAIANILYNSNVQIASTTGVPIEISNSYKVDGKRYLSTNIGCKNKWSITETPSGLYFVDDLNKKLYLFQQGLKCISEEKGFNSWFHEQCNNNIWTPKDSLNFVTYFDNYYRELLLINKDNCLAFSEVSNEFTSFYSYEKTPYFTNLNKERLFIKYGNNGNSEFYLGNTSPDSSGTNKYFFEEKPVYVTLKIQSNPLMDKVFNGVEYRNEFYTADGKDNFITDEHMFDNLNIWTDYQSGTLDINKVVGLPSSLKQKFRINRVLLPRDTSNQNPMKQRDRIRNPWAFIQLKADTNKAKFRIHDIVVNYTE